jgi:hypothetical protein
LSNTAVEAAAGILSDIDAAEVEVDISPSSNTEAVAETPQETAPEAPTINLDPPLPPDILMDVDADDEPEEEPPAWDDDHGARLAQVDSEDLDEYVDPQVAHLRAELKRAQKQAEYEKGLRLKSDRKKWEKEAAQFFPLADPSTIKAESRRAFRREAHAQHERMKNNPQFKAFLESERQRVRQEAEQAWGKPTAGPGAPPSEALLAENAIDEARKTGRLDKTIYAMFNRDGIR